jgi:hypothetical protein
MIVLTNMTTTVDGSNVIIKKEYTAFKLTYNWFGLVTGWKKTRTFTQNEVIPLCNNCGYGYGCQTIENCREGTEEKPNFYKGC